MSDWIKVSDRFPHEERSVLCFREYDNWYVVADYIYPAFWIDFSEGQVAHAITHWMPLPEMPKE
jgi:hypothetical protein